MRVTTLLLPVALATLAPLLWACAPLQTPQTAAPAEAHAPAPAAPKAQAFTEAQVLADLNALINDTVPASPDDDARRAALAPAAQAQELSPQLRRVLAQVLAFTPPRLRERWQAHQQALDNAAALYAANPPENLSALEGARVVRRLGPVLYLVRLSEGDTVLLNTTRRLKNGAKLKGLSALERPRPKADRSKGDLVDELADQPRTFDEISRQDAKRRNTQRTPVLSELKKLESASNEFERGVATDLARLDALTRDANAVIGPLLLPQAHRPAPVSLIRKVARVAKSYNRNQYYRYTLPVTGKPKVDATLKAYLDDRKAEVQDLLRSTGIGKGRTRTNVDRITFAAYTASPRLLSIRFEEFRDTGGAHPNQAYATFLFNLNTQAQLSLADLFSNTEAALTVLSELASRRLELALDGNLFPDGLAAKPDNFAVFVLDGADLVFTFPPYQVASYAQGTQTLRVPLFHPRLLPLLSPALKDALAAKE